MASASNNTDHAVDLSTFDSSTLRFATPRKSKNGTYINISRVTPEGIQVPLVIKSPVDEKLDTPDNWSFTSKGVTLSKFGTHQMLFSLYNREGALPFQQKWVTDYEEKVLHPIAENVLPILKVLRPAGTKGKKQMVEQILDDILTEKFGGLVPPKEEKYGMSYSCSLFEQENPNFPKNPAKNTIAPVFYNASGTRLKVIPQGMFNVKFEIRIESVFINNTTTVSPKLNCVLSKVVLANATRVIVDGIEAGEVQPSVGKSGRKMNFNIEEEKSEPEVEIPIDESKADDDDD